MASSSSKIEKRSVTIPTGDANWTLFTPLSGDVTKEVLSDGSIRFTRHLIVIPENTLGFALDKALDNAALWYIWSNVLHFAPPPRSDVLALNPLDLWKFILQSRLLALFFGDQTKPQLSEDEKVFALQRAGRAYAMKTMGRVLPPPTTPPTVAVAPASGGTGGAGVKVIPMLDIHKIASDVRRLSSGRGTRPPPFLFTPRPIPPQRVMDRQRKLESRFRARRVPIRQSLFMDEDTTTTPAYYPFGAAAPQMRYAYIDTSQDSTGPQWWFQGIPDVSSRSGITMTPPEWTPSAPSPTSTPTSTPTPTPAPPFSSSMLPPSSPSSGVAAGSRVQMYVHFRTFNPDGTVGWDRRIVDIRSLPMQRIPQRPDLRDWTDPSFSLSATKMSGGPGNVWIYEWLPNTMGLSVTTVPAAVPPPPSTTTVTTTTAMTTPPTTPSAPPLPPPPPPTTTTTTSALPPPMPPSTPSTVPAVPSMSLVPVTTPLPASSSSSYSSVPPTSPFPSTSASFPVTGGGGVSAGTPINVYFRIVNPDGTFRWDTRLLDVQSLPIHIIPVRPDRALNWSDPSFLLTANRSHIPGQVWDYEWTSNPTAASSKTTTIPPGSTIIPSTLPTLPSPAPPPPPPTSPVISKFLPYDLSLGTSPATPGYRQDEYKSREGKEQPPPTDDEIKELLMQIEGDGTLRTRFGGYTSVLEGKTCYGLDRKSIYDDIKTMVDLFKRLKSSSSSSSDSEKDMICRRAKDIISDQLPPEPIVVEAQVMEIARNNILTAVEHNLINMNRFQIEPRAIFARRRPLFSMDPVYADSGAVLITSELTGSSTAPPRITSVAGGEDREWMFSAQTTFDIPSTMPLTSQVPLTRFVPLAAAGIAGPYVTTTATEPSLSDRRKIFDLIQTVSSSELSSYSVAHLFKHKTDPTQGLELRLIVAAHPSAVFDIQELMIETKKRNPTAIHVIDLQRNAQGKIVYAILSDNPASATLATKLSFREAIVAAGTAVRTGVAGTVSSALNWITPDIWKRWTAPTTFRGSIVRVQVDFIPGELAASLSADELYVAWCMCAWLAGSCIHSDDINIPEFLWSDHCKHSPAKFKNMLARFATTSLKWLFAYKLEDVNKWRQDSVLWSMLIYGIFDRRITTEGDLRVPITGVTDSSLVELLDVKAACRTASRSSPYGMAMNAISNYFEKDQSAFIQHIRSQSKMDTKINNFYQFMGNLIRPGFGSMSASSYDSAGPITTTPMTMIFGTYALTNESDRTFISTERVSSYILTVLRNMINISIHAAVEQKQGTLGETSPIVKVTYWIPETKVAAAMGQCASTICGRNTDRHIPIVLESNSQYRFASVFVNMYGYDLPEETVPATAVAGGATATSSSSPVASLSPFVSPNTYTFHLYTYNDDNVMRELESVQSSLSYQEAHLLTSLVSSTVFGCTIVPERILSISSPNGCVQPFRLRESMYKYCTNLDERKRMNKIHTDVYRTAWYIASAMDIFKLSSEINTPMISDWHLQLSHEYYVACDKRISAASRPGTTTGSTTSATASTPSSDEFNIGDQTMAQQMIMTLYLQIFVHHLILTWGDLVYSSNVFGDFVVTTNASVSTIQNQMMMKRCNAGWMKSFEWNKLYMSLSYLRLVRPEQLSEWTRTTMSSASSLETLQIETDHVLGTLEQYKRLQRYTTSLFAIKKTQLPPTDEFIQLMNYCFSTTFLSMYELIILVRLMRLDNSVLVNTYTNNSSTRTDHPWISLKIWLQSRSGTTIPTRDMVFLALEHCLIFNNWVDQSGFQYFVFDKWDAILDDAMRTP